MAVPSEGSLLRVFVGESDQWHGRPLYQAIVERLRREGFAGATVLRGILGYGASTKLHAAHAWDVSEQMPVVIEVVDSTESIERILRWLDEIVTKGLVTVERADVLAYQKKTKGT